MLDRHWKLAIIIMQLLIFAWPHAMYGVLIPYFVVPQTTSNHILMVATLVQVLDGPDPGPQLRFEESQSTSKYWTANVFRCWKASKH